MSNDEFPRATTAVGTVRGRREDGLAVFRGIPYAQPPVGEARFAAPRPVNRRDGVRDAFAFGPPPPQEPFGPEPAPADGPPPGDDWLTVNVWTPDADPAARRPVMVWIYGGAYKFGSADDPAYDGNRLARDGGLVVVTLNYRVGIEGFLQIEGRPPTVVCSTRSPPWSGCATTSPPSAATPTRSLSSVSRRAPGRSPR